MPSTPRSVVLAALAALALPLVAVAQPADPFGGLDTGVLEVAGAIDSGDAGRIVAYVPPAGATQTAYPGDGTPVDRITAVAAIFGAVVSSPGTSDALGTGRYRLIAIWSPAVALDQVFLVGSGIDGSGTRISTVFTVAKTGRTILAYGRAADTTAVLEQFASQGDLRRIRPGTPVPGAPPSGNGSASPAAREIPFILAGIGVAAIGAILLSFSRRFQ